MNLLWMFVITFCILQMSVLATTIYLHRSVTHRGVELHPLVRNLMHLHLMLFTAIVPREWAAVHRKHHHFSDREGDPHSPHIEGLWTVFFGNFFMYRKETHNQQTIRKYTPDYKPDLVDLLVPSRIQAYGALAGLAIFMLLFGWAWGLAAWACHVVAYILLNSSINSLCHMVGYRNYENLATNLRFLSFFTGGEALHNNHHEFPTSARFSMKPGEFDIAWPLIRLMESVGLAKVDRTPIAKAA
jgi:stearoyl-CoA desaturase (delta-9 desaturase)